VLKIINDKESESYKSNLKPVELEIKNNSDNNENKIVSTSINKGEETEINLESAAEKTEYNEVINPETKNQLSSGITIDLENTFNLSGEEKNISDSRLNIDQSTLVSFFTPAIVPKKRSKFKTQFYFTPTVSYRKLTENKKPNPAGNYSYSQLMGINNMVKHKPLMGLEFGIEGKYKVLNNVFLKSGLQFNINRYDISAYSHPAEVATVSVNSGFRTYSLSSVSNYGNQRGYTQNWLENFYFQAAIPIGAEVILANGKNTSIGISGSIQPTFVIGDRAYLISNDYKNYAKFPDLMRRWNISSGFETFVAYSAGKIKWQVGPHVRYQHLSSFVSGYPVKENLFAIGLKVGATFNNK
jgi:hypothetical protein